jgi:chromosome segregation ATPase
MNTLRKKRNSLTLFQRVSESTFLDATTTDSSARALAACLKVESDKAAESPDNNIKSNKSVNNVTALKKSRSRAASEMFWEEGVPEMPVDNKTVVETTRRRSQSYELLEEELERKEAELKMAAEIGLKLFEKSEASTKRCEELNIQVRDLSNQLIELEMENEVMQRRQVAQRKRQEEISKENIKLSSDIGQVDSLKSELEEARATIALLESSYNEQPSKYRRSSRRLSLGGKNSVNGGIGSNGSIGGNENNGSTRDIADHGIEDNETTKNQIENDPAKVIELENQLDVLQMELAIAKKKTTLVEKSNLRVLELESLAKENKINLDELRIENDVSRNNMRQAMNKCAKFEEQLEEDKDIINMLRSRITDLEEELAAAGNSNDAMDSRSRFSSRADVVLDEIREQREHSESQMSYMSSNEHIDTELQDRLVAKLQESTTQLMLTQTELNSAENELQKYKRQYAEWIQAKKPEFTVESSVNHERGYVLYQITLLQNNKEKLHFIEHRYSEVSRFRAELKRALFVNDNLGSIRLPALPPKVWGHSRSQSQPVVEKRVNGIKIFLNILLALSELSEPIRTHFFNWIGFDEKQQQQQKVEKVEEVEEVEEKRE